MIPISRAALATHKVWYGTAIRITCQNKFNHVIFIFNSKYVKIESVGQLQQGFNLEWLV